MNIFRLIGDVSHLIAIFYLLIKGCLLFLFINSPSTVKNKRGFLQIWKSKSCLGVSAKSQILLAVVFATRYLDLLFFPFISLYLTIMKIIFLAASIGTVYLMLIKYKSTYEVELDVYRVEMLLIACAVLALVINSKLTTLEVFWTFSVYLEAVALLPQFSMLKSPESAETVSKYLIGMLIYKLGYLLNWVYRYHSAGFHNYIALFSGNIQCVLNARLIYLYMTRVVDNPVPQIFHI